MIRVFQIDVWFATLAHALKVKCGSVLTPVLRTLIVAANDGAIFIAVSLAMLAFRGTRKAGCAALIALAASALLTEVFLLSKCFCVGKPGRNIYGCDKSFGADADERKQNFILLFPRTGREQLYRRGRRADHIAGKGSRSVRL